MIKWFTQLVCSHRYVYSDNGNHQDFEEWYECDKCGKQKEFDGTI